MQQQYDFDKINSDLFAVVNCTTQASFKCLEVGCLEQYKKNTKKVH